MGKKCLSIFLDFGIFGFAKMAFEHKSILQYFCVYE